MRSKVACESFFIYTIQELMNQLTTLWWVFIV